MVRRGGGSRKANLQIIAGLGFGLLIVASAAGIYTFKSRYEEAEILRLTQLSKKQEKAGQAKRIGEVARELYQSRPFEPLKTSNASAPQYEIFSTNALANQETNSLDGISENAIAYSFQDKKSESRQLALYGMPAPEVERPSFSSSIARLREYSDSTNSPALPVIENLEALRAADYMEIFLNSCLPKIL